MACLAVLWTMGEGTVWNVAAAMAPRHPLAYTTVMTLLERLVRRGQVSRRKAGRSFVYAPAHDPAGLREIAISELARDYFGGSRESLRAWLNGTQIEEPRRETLQSETIDTALL